MAVFGEESGPCFEKANELYARALQTNPKYVSAYANLGLLLHRLGRFEESVQVFEKGLAVVRGRFPAMVQWRDETAALARMPAWKREILLAENLRNIGDFRAAQRFFERGIAGIRASPAAPPEETAESRRIAHAGLARLFAQASEGRHGASAPATPVPPEDLRASRERSLAHLKEAMGLGWDPRQGGRDLDPLRGLPEFEALTKEQREKPAKGEGK
ncbi:MAG: tetratricopeptide repeat protein [Planctomycetes bacterium]|nr:tetratricopeptide repeat protein [Planctomycetota bacterium]